MNAQKQSVTGEPSYQVWTSIWQDLRPGPQFALLSEAIHYVRSHRGARSHAIRRPDGTWYRWSDDGTVVLPR